MNAQKYKMLILKLFDFRKNLKIHKKNMIKSRTFLLLFYIVQRDVQGENAHR